MKKFLSISFSLLILVSGLQLTVSTHYCGGKIAASKVSVSGALASCGMEAPVPVKQCTTTGTHLESNCCNTKVSVFAIDNNYPPSVSDYKSFSQTVLQVFDIPVSYQIQSLSVLSLYSTNVSPPGDFVVSAVSLPYICVFRI